MITFRNEESKPAVLVIHDGDKKKFYGIKNPSWLRRLWWRVTGRHRKMQDTIEIYGKFPERLDN